MTEEPKYSVTFKAEDVISAQRMRFLRSSKFKIVVGFWGIAAIWGIAVQLLPGVAPPIPYVSASTVLGSTVLFALIVAAFYWFGPLIEFHNNPIWKTPFQMQVTGEHVMLMMDGRVKGVFIRWEQIRNVHENERAYILYTRSEDNFLILPKSVFPDLAAQERFRAQLFTRSFYAINRRR